MKALNSTITRNTFVHFNQLNGNLSWWFPVWIPDFYSAYKRLHLMWKNKRTLQMQAFNAHLNTDVIGNIVTSNEEKSWGKLSKNWKQFLILLCWYFLLNIWLLLFIDKNSFHKRRLDVAGQTNSGMKNEGKITWLEPGYFLLQLSNCMMETCMLLAGVSVHEHWWPQ